MQHQRVDYISNTQPQPILFSRSSWEQCNFQVFEYIFFDQSVIKLSAERLLNWFWNIAKFLKKQENIPTMLWVNFVIYEQIDVTQGKTREQANLMM